MKSVLAWLSVGAAVVGIAVIAITSPEWGMRDAVRAKLYDPESAEFRGVVRSDRDVCGEVNGKSRFGAYAGFSAFYARKTGDGQWLVVIDQDGTDAARTMCERL